MQKNCPFPFFFLLNLQKPFYVQILMRKIHNPINNKVLNDENPYAKWRKICDRIKIDIKCTSEVDIILFR